MRVTHVLPQLALKSGGPTRSVLGLARAEAALGAEVTLVIGRSEETEVLDTSGVTVVDGRLASVRYGVPGPRLVRRLHRAIAGADVVHLHSHWNVISTLAAALARHLHKPYVLSPRGMLDARSLAVRPRSKRLYYAALERRSIEGAAAFLFLDHSEREALWRGAVPSLAAVVLVCPNGVDLDHVRAAAHAAKDEVWAPHRQQPHVRLVYLGRIHPLKGLLLQVEAVALLRQRGIEARLSLVGPDGAHAHEVQRAAVRLGVADAVALPGPAYGDERFGFLAACDAVLLTSELEGFSNTAAETLAVGGLLIATDTCHLHEAGAAGAAIIVPRTAVAVADAVAKVVADPTLAGATREAALEFAARRLDWRVIAAEVLRLYERVIRR